MQISSISIVVTMWNFSVLITINTPNFIDMHPQNFR